MHALDSTTWQIIVSEDNSDDYEYAVVSAIYADNIYQNTRFEKAYKNAVENAHQRAKKLVKLLSNLEK